MRSRRALVLLPAMPLLLPSTAVPSQSWLDAAHNMDLSKRRAEAVKSVLVSQFGIEAGRLTTAGLGASKPVASNSTPQGKAENRRVEIVRQ